jgi:transcriptional regulator with XRE-family HTH domain
VKTTAPQDIYAFLGARLRQARKAKGLTLEQVAAGASTNASFLSYVETAKKKPSVAMLHRLSQALGVPLSEIFADAPFREEPAHGPAARLSELLNDAPPKQRAAILRFVRSFSRTGK